MLNNNNNLDNASREQLIRAHHNNQMQKVMRCNKAFSDFIKSYADIEPVYRQYVIAGCVEIACKWFENNESEGRSK